LLSTVSGLSFNEWASQHGKAYKPSELTARRAVFEENLRQITELNSQGLSWVAGTNQWSDLTFEEFKAAVGLREAQNCSATRKGHPMSGVQIPTGDEVDWTTKGVVTPVKDQGSCGSCWTFSTTGAVESAYAIATGKLLTLSEQQLVDCAGAFNNFGCNGGLPSQAFQYIMSAGGLEEEAQYPYKAKDGECQFSSEAVAAKISDEVNVTAGSETELTDAVKTHGPVSICYQVVSDFQHYTSGVYESTKCKNGPQDVNHAVLAVGYGVDDTTSKPYYLVKNSWGPTFGIKGYFKIIRGQNMCGIATCASYPVV